MLGQEENCKFLLTSKSLGSSRCWLEIIILNISFKILRMIYNNIEFSKDGNTWDEGQYRFFRGWKQLDWRNMEYCKEDKQLVWRLVKIKETKFPFDNFDGLINPILTDKENTSVCKVPTGGTETSCFCNGLLQSFWIFFSPRFYKQY